MELDYLITGAYGNGNFGDDVLLDCIVQEIYRTCSSSKIGLLIEEKEYLAERYPYIIFVSRDKTRTINVKNYIFGGGTQFYSFPKKHSVFSKFVSVLSNRQLLKRKLFRQGVTINAKNKILLGVGVGPFKDVQDERKIINKLRDFDKVLVRDEISSEYCSKYDVKHELTADICFSMLDFYEESQVNDAKKVLIIPRDWSMGNYGDKYIENLKRYTLKNKKYDITYCLFADDIEWKKWLQENKINHFVWDNNCSIKSFLEKLNSFDVFVTARYHGCVFGTILKRPCIAINIEPKLILGSEQNVGFIWEVGYKADELDSLIGRAIKNDYSGRLIDVRKKYNKLSTLNKVILSGLL